jgi:shikimate kinase / 3-dehydroquinate synthase
MTSSTIYIYGPPGVGKSTIGKILAANLNLPFVDLDAEIEKVAGTTIPEIFENEGEEAFREREERALKSVGETSVVSLGGGALLRRASRNYVRDEQIICLSASLAALTERLQKDGNQRPLLQNNALESFLEGRKEHYASFPIQLDTENRSPEQCATEIQERLGRFYLRGMGQGYAARVENGALENLANLLTEHGCKPPYMLICDSDVAPIYAEKVAQVVEVSKVVFPAGEKNKTVATMTQLWRDLVGAGMERGGTILALGGGITNDMAGFAAATIMRGAAWVSIPTSLLCMVDASLGGKTGANLPSGKNLVGAFYPPKLVLADPATLQTLPEAEIRNGLAEVVKHGVIADPELLGLCKNLSTKDTKDEWAKLVIRAMSVKIRIIEEDPYEKGIRAALNFGHTIGHGIESLTNYGIRHGEAVGIGMVVEARLAEQMGISETGLADEIAETLVSLGLPIDIPNGISAPALVAAMQSDKKKSKGVVKFALPVRVGKMKVGVVIERLEEKLSRLCSQN